MQTLINRLTDQLAAGGQKDAKAEAIAILQKRGHVDANGNLTPEGLKRQNLGPAGRAKDRAAKASDHKASEYVYNRKTNKATLKR